MGDGEAGRASRVRAFVALEIPEPIGGTLALYLDLCRAAAPAFRWVPPASLHLTLRFLGSVSPDVLDGLRSGLGRLDGRAFRLRLDGIGTFGGRAAPRVIWIDLREGAEQAAALAALVETACQAAGMEPEARRFRGHVTLARARAARGSPLPELPPPPALEPWTATELVLYESRLGKPAATYVPLQRYRLG